MAGEGRKREPYLKQAEAFVREVHRHGGLAPVDLEKFWADNEVANRDPFGKDIPQAAMGLRMGGQCVFAELGIEEDMWRYSHDEAWALSLNKAYNDKAEKIVGRRLLNEQPKDPNLQYPPVGGLHDVFEAKREWRADSWWLMQSANNEDELKALLDRVDGKDVRSVILPEGWEEERDRLMGLGGKPRLYRGQRGPVTFATSIYGVENLLFLLIDNPDLAVRFSQTILRTMLEIARVMDEEAGYTPETAPHGFGFADDNCCLLSPKMYELFAFPILKEIFDRYSPDPEDSRGQHSDSDMRHIVPVLGRLNLTSVNFGPPVLAEDIRPYLPRAVIRGVLAPFTFSRNEEVNIVAEFLRDFDQTKESRGLCFTTAGSINNGSLLTSLRLVMAAIQRFGTRRRGSRRS